MCVLCDVLCCVIVLLLGVLYFLLLMFVCDVCNCVIVCVCGVCFDLFFGCCDEKVILGWMVMNCVCIL